MDATTRGILASAIAEVEDIGLRTRLALYWFLTAPATAVHN